MKKTILALCVGALLYSVLGFAYQANYRNITLQNNSSYAIAKSYEGPPDVYSHLAPFSTEEVRFQHYGLRTLYLYSNNPAGGLYGFCKLHVGITNEISSFYVTDENINPRFPDQHRFTCMTLGLGDKVQIIPFY